ncbi:MAG: AmmeMemoRadiSam system protein B [Kiritimatiellia bacterium]
MKTGSGTAIQALVLCLGLLLPAGVGCRAEESGNAGVRPAIAASKGFYPSTPARLKEMVRGFLENAPERKGDGPIVAALAPHAGYFYSGAVAACTHKALAGADFDTLVIIGHDTGAPDTVAFLSPADYFATPLGKVPVDRDMIEKMLEADSNIREKEFGDHSVEVHLPFLQLTRGEEFRIVPALFGSPNLAKCRAMADAIRSAAGKKKVIVLASTDMSHYPPYEVAGRLDRSTLTLLKGGDAGKLYSHLESAERSGKFAGVQTAMCAKGGVGTALMFAKDTGQVDVEVLKYANSGDVAMEARGNVVGYSSVIISVKGGK